MATEPKTNGALCLAWRDLNYEVVDRDKKDKQMKRILQNVNGHIQSGTVTAVLGPSGSGKTSLLNCISTRTKNGVTGSITVNGQPMEPGFRRNIGYVAQDDAFHNALTVRETLLYTAELKLKKPRAEIKKIVERVLSELDLTREGLPSSLIGEIGEGISGGERRRLAIARAIIDDPIVLLLDEPTSGLDSASALMVTKILKNLAQEKNIAVMCSIHQPRMQVLKSFDRLSLMGTGKVLYFGPTIPEAMDFFNEAGYECPQYENPADFMLDLVNTQDEEKQRELMRKKKRGDRGGISSTRSNESTNSRGMETEGIELKTVEVESDALSTRQKIVNNLADRFLKDPLYKESLGPDASEGGGFDMHEQEQGYRTSTCNQIFVLTRRNFMNKLREPVAAATQLFSATVMPFIVGLVYWDLGDGQTSISDRIRLVSLAVLLQSFIAFDDILLFPAERRIFLRENMSGLYRTSAYVASKAFSETPMHIFFAVVASPIFYFMPHLQNDADKFFIFLIIMTLATLNGAAMMCLFGAMGKNMEQANILATIFLVLFMILDGTWVDLSRIPAGLQWIGELSFMGQAVKAAIKNEFTGLTFACEQTDPGQGVPCFHTGEQALQFYGFEDVSVSGNIAKLCGLFAGFKILTYFAVRFMHTGQTVKERLKS